MTPTAPIPSPHAADPPSGPRIVVRGWGLVTPLGTGAWPTFTALLAGRMLAERAAKLPDDISAIDLVRATGSVGAAQVTGADPAVVLAELAGREALMHAGAAADVMPVIAGASKGAVVAMHDAMQRFIGRASRDGDPTGALDRPSISDAPLAVALGPHGYLSHHLAQRLGMPVCRNIVAACASSLMALHDARLLLTHEPSDGNTRRMLVVTTEAALLPTYIGSYRRLGVLPALRPGQYAGRPLDAARTGFMLAELAAAVVLERVDHDAGFRPGDIELVDTAVAADAFDMVRTNPAMTALDRVASTLLAGRRIDMLHPHATGTVEHDPAETAVYAKHLAGTNGSPLPDTYAVKGAIGHGLGAAGLVSLVVACMCAKAGRRPPMAWLDQPIDSPLPLSRDPQPASLAASTHAVFAAGFGGHTAGAVIARRM